MLFSVPALSPRAKTILTVVLGLAWITSGIVAARALLRYENEPGRIGQISSAWPDGSAVEWAKDQPTLLMFAHPQCPCTRASMDELAQIMAHVNGKLRVYALFYTPAGADKDWQNSGSRRTAEQIPGVTVLSDINGVEAQRFGAETSGHVFLFDPNGHLLFNGGITGSRGHSGDNAGVDAILSLVNKQGSSRPQTSVFGCSFRSKISGDHKCSK